MTSAWLWLITAWLVNYAGAIAPAFAPPSWALLATFRILGRPPLLALGIGGSLFGALGKATLAWGARRGSRFLHRTDRENVKALMAPLERRPRARVAFTAVYSLGPFPSNLLFIAVGVGGRSIREAALIFFLCRAVSDTFWMWLAADAARGPAETTLAEWFSLRSLALEGVSVVLIVATFKLPWARWLLRVSSDRQSEGEMERHK